MFGNKKLMFNISVGESVIGIICPSGELLKYLQDYFSIALTNRTADFVIKF